MWDGRMRLGWITAWTVLKAPAGANNQTMKGNLFLSTRGFSSVRCGQRRLHYEVDVSQKLRNASLDNLWKDQ